MKLAGGTPALSRKAAQDLFLHLSLIKVKAAHLRTLQIMSMK